MQRLINQDIVYDKNSKWS